MQVWNAKYTASIKNTVYNLSKSNMAHITSQQTKLQPIKSLCTSVNLVKVKVKYPSLDATVMDRS